jgi:hypothetical protein
VQFAGQLRGADLLLAACSEIAAKVGEPQGAGTVVEAALLLVDDREAAADAEPATRLCWWGRYTCAWRAGRPTTPG